MANLQPLLTKGARRLRGFASNEGKKAIVKVKAASTLSQRFFSPHLRTPRYLFACARASLVSVFVLTFCKRYFEHNIIAFLSLSRNNVQSYIERIYVYTNFRLIYFIGKFNPIFFDSMYSKNLKFIY